MKKYEHLLKLRSMCISIEAEKTEGEGQALLMQGRWRLGCNMTESDIGPETQFAERPQHRLRQNRECHRETQSAMRLEHRKARL